MTATMSKDLLEVAFRSTHLRKPRTRLVLCALADHAEDDTGKVTTSVRELARIAGLSLRSTLLSLNDLERSGVLDVAFGETLAHGDQPDVEQTFLLHVPKLRERAGMLTDVDHAVRALGELGAEVVE